MADQRKVWTAIAESFDRTRQRPWPHVATFLEALPPGSRLLDLMCGNGRHAKVAQALGHEVVALDWSAPLLARSAGERVLADAVALPLREAAVDACVFAAGLHGLPTAGARDSCLRQLQRVLRAGGAAQVTVWSHDAPRFRGGPADVEVPWKAAGTAAMRTYHLYSAATLRAALEEAGFVVESVRGVALAAEEPDNLVAVARKE